MAALKRGMQLYGAGDPLGGERIAGELLARDPEDVQALGLRAMCLVQLARLPEALEAADAGVGLAPREPMLLALRARTLRLLGRSEEALEAYRTALVVQPGMETAAAGAAELLLSLKRVDEAAEVLNPLLSRGFRNHQVGLAGARLARLRGQSERGIRLLTPFAEHSGLPPAVRVEVLFGLADLYQELGRDAEAVETVRVASRLRGSRFSAAAHRRAVDRFIAAFTPAIFERLVRAKDNAGLRPIFVVGLPRSGTTLVERILAAHPSVTACGELDGMQRLTMEAQSGRPLSWVLQDPQALTRPVIEAGPTRYASGVPLDAGDGWMTDKMPANVMYLPLIRLVFPEAPIIRCLRDPRDTAVSCFFQHFGAANDWAYDDAQLVSYFKDVERVYKHCRNALAIDVLEVQYEDLVRDPDPLSRQIVTHTGLNWDDACLRPHEVEADARTRSVDQVNRPMYTSSVGRWKRYESLLGGMLSQFD